MKRTKIAFLLVLLMSMAGIRAFAYDFCQENSDGVTIYYNKINGNTELQVTKPGSTDPKYSGVVNLPEKANGLSVTSIDTQAFAFSNLTSVNIPKSVTEIGYDAFSNCNSLSTITVDSDNPVYYSPEGSNAIIVKNSKALVVGCQATDIPVGVESIGNYAFYGCSSLNSITIPGSVLDIYPYAFASCKNLTSVTIQNGMENQYIMSYAFAGCENLASVTIPSTVTDIGEGAFNRCNKLTKVYISDLKAWCNIDFICTPDHPHPFSWNHGLYLNGELITDLVIPDGVTSIKEGAFYGCTNQFSVTIPSAVTSIGKGAFNGCNGLQSVTVKIDEPLKIDESTFTKRKGVTLYVPIDCGEAYRNADYWRDFTIVEMLPAIISFADANVKAKCVENWDTNGDGEIDESEAAAVTELSDVFSNLPITSFDELQYFTGLTSIDGSAFRNCSSLTSITIPDNVTTIGWGAFNGCTGLTSITIPDNVTSIGGNAFYNCTGLTSVTINSNSITEISGSPFYGCTGLTSFDIPSSVTSIGTRAFQECSSLTSITIPSSVTSIASDAFQGCTGLTSMIVESGNAIFDSRDDCNAIIKTASNTLIAGCKTTVIPNSVTAIGDLAFYGCSGLTSITIPSSVTSIALSAFSGCIGLTSMIVESGNATYDSRDNCNAIIETASNKLIAGCKATVIPNSVTAIGDGAFQYCSTLTTVVIPDGVTSIGNGAFYNCSGLTSVYVEWDYPISISSSVFYNSNYKNATLYVPAGTKAAYEAVSTWSAFASIVEMESEPTEPEPTSVTITMAKGMSTFCCDKDVDFSATPTLKAYIATGFNRSSGDVLLSRVYEVPQNTGVVLKGEANTTYEVPCRETFYCYQNYMIGTTTVVYPEPEDGFTDYILSNGVFIRLSTGGKVNAGKAYLHVPSRVATARQLNIIFEDEDGTTGIDTVHNSESTKQDEVYNLNGQRVSQPRKGLYIKNGRKVIIK